MAKTRRSFSVEQKLQIIQEVRQPSIYYFKFIVDKWFLVEVENLSYQAGQTHSDVEKINLVTGIQESYESDLSKVSKIADYKRTILHGAHPILLQVFDGNYLTQSQP